MEEIMLEAEEIAAEGAEEAREDGNEMEIERRVSEALKSEREKWKLELERRLAQERAEAEALARMSGEERMAHELAQKAAQLDAREREILRRELRAEAARLVEERGLPCELTEMVNCESMERVQDSLNLIEHAFRMAVQRGVEARMRGRAPSAARWEESGNENDEDYYRARYQSGRKE